MSAGFVEHLCIAHVEMSYKQTTFQIRKQVSILRAKKESVWCALGGLFANVENDSLLKLNRLNDCPKVVKLLC